MARRVSTPQLGLLLLMAACRTGGTAEGVPVPLENGVPAQAAPPDAGVALAQSDAGFTATVDAVESYREHLTSAFASVARARFVETVSVSGAPSADVHPHKVLVFRQTMRPRAYFVLTSGFGRVARASAAKEARNVELVAHADAYGEAIADILSLLGARLHLEGDGAEWKVYDAIKLEKPHRSLQYFDLRPGGEVDVDGTMVTLFRVFPLTREEYEQAGKGSQWLDSDAADPDAAVKSLARWKPALEPAR